MWRIPHLILLFSFKNYKIFVKESILLGKDLILQMMVIDNNGS
jgi:hypothetical protein